MKHSLYILFFIAAFALYGASYDDIISADYLSARGEPLHKKGWERFDCSDSASVKGGSVTRAATGTFDSFHINAVRGTCAAGHEYFYDTLMAASCDETDVFYPLIAERVEYKRDNSWFVFYLNRQAKNQSGEPITAEDAAFSFNILYEKGVPQFRSYYRGVTAEALDKRRVRFNIPQKLDDDGKPAFDSGGRAVYDKNLMLSLCDMPVFVKKFWEGRDFSEPLTVPPEGTGPYRVKEYATGRWVVLERVKDYWASELPVNKGRYNFDTIRYDYYKDSNVAFEAFKAGEYDYRRENSPKNWIALHSEKSVESGRVKLEEIPNSTAQPMQAFVFNTQKDIFSDRRIRKAMQYFLDFEWMNKQFFYDTYTRTRSYFQNTVYEAKGLPDAAERAVLEPVRKKIPAEVFDSEYAPPRNPGNGYIRDGAREALKLFAEAGWELKNGKLTNASGKRFEFEILLYSAETERIAAVFRRNCARYGIDMKIRVVDTSQFINRLRSRDFDMIFSVYPENKTPSSSLMIIWNTKHIDSTWNTAGVSDEAVDYLTQAIAGAQEDGNKLLALGRALDRVLTRNYYVIPHWNLPVYRVAFNGKFAHPKRLPDDADRILDFWWSEK